MAILPTHAGMDMRLFEKIIVCTPEHFTDADCTMTNEQILMLPTHDAQALCRKCKFKSLSNSGTLVMKNISTSGSLSEMSLGLPACFCFVGFGMMSGVLCRGRKGKTRDEGNEMTKKILQDKVPIPTWDWIGG
jgi:hypothetical protein